MATWKHTCTALLLVMSSCGRPPRLTDYDANADYLTEIFPAPVVVVAVIDSDNLVRKPIPSRRTPGLLLQLRRVDMRVENVLRGSVPKGLTTIYYFAWNEFSGGNIPLGAWKPGDRRIFWLRQDAGVLRTACDARDCTMPVYNGAHPQYEADQHKALGYALADIWFTRGQSATDADFAKQVDWGYPSTVPEAYVVENMRRLAATESALVKAAACTQLSYLGQPCAPTSGR
jgi:hypothetical protein